MERICEERIGEERRWDVRVQFQIAGMVMLDVEESYESYIIL